MEDYTYSTPQGYGDTFYVYAYDSNILPLVSGQNYFNQRVVISDGDFVLRWWKGCDLYSNISQGIQIRDKLQNQFFSDTINPFSQAPNLMGPYMSTGWPVCPEKWYPDQGYIGFDLFSALPNVSPNTSAIGQLAFYGVRRRKGFKNDPQVYTSPAYEKEYQTTVTVKIPAGFSSTSGGLLTTVNVTDFEFEMRRIDGFVRALCFIPTSGYAGLDLGNFKILLLDQNKVQISNVPLLFANLFHVPNNAVAESTQASANSIPKHFWPTPPMTYRVNSAIQFYIYATSATPSACEIDIDITFSGIRRYPCL